jgi:acetate kinase
VSSILVVNAGSTSLKLSVIGEDDNAVALDAFADVPAGIEAVVHRVVHGGARFRDPVLIDAEVREQIFELVSLAPLHNAPALEAIEAAEQAFSSVPHVAVFDTSFHRTLPREAAAYAVPRRWREDWGVRRYGFHGLSVEWSVARTPNVVGRPVRRMVVCHLGGGSSVTAVVDGKSVDTTMGFSPLEGVPMTTRSGSIDPGALLHVLQTHGLDADAVDHELNFDSGLKALAGGSGDMIDVEKGVAAGDADAAFALDVYVYRLATAVGTMAAAARGIDVLVFTAGIGEHSSLVRERVCDRLGFLDLELDQARNHAPEPDCDVATAGSAARIAVIRAREELVAARAARTVLTKLSPEEETSLDASGA